MIVESMDHYLDILNGYVYDNDKVVTYKWLSKELGVHVNIAKQVLWEFWQKHGKEDNITSTVMLIGYLKSGGMRVEVVKQSNLDTAKDKFSKITSEHLYSVQKSIPDLEFHFINDEGDVKFSAIKCNESIERSDEELTILRWGSLFKDLPAPKNNNLNPPNNNKPVEEVKISETIKNNNQTSKKSTDKKTSPVSQKTGFNNLFGKAINKENNVKSSTSKDVKNNTEITPEKTSADKSNSSSKENKFVKKEEKKGISSYFGKNANVIKDSPKEKETKEDEKKENHNVKDNVEDNKKMEVISKKGNDKTEKGKRGTKRNRSKESKNNTMKKRKRIIVETDSSDSQSEEDEDMKSESEPEEVEEMMDVDDIKKSPSPPPVINSNGKARILKIVDHTYEEDGFLVTKKVHVYEEVNSEDITEIKPKEESTNVAKVQTKKKQTTLMNFFKRT